MTDEPTAEPARQVAEIDPELADEVDRQLEIMAAGSVDFFGREELRPRLAEALQQQRPLRVKLGMDPTAPDLHLGHTVVLHKLRAFQQLGHTPIFLIGDFTASIGDPSGRNKTRPALAADEIAENARTYVAQVGKVLDVERGEVRFNGDWMNAFSPADFVKLCSHYTVARLLERDDFAKRYAEGTPIFTHELLYPFVQAYDSVALEADVELGGTDQMFNMLMAREVQRAYGQAAQAVITHPLLVGTDGREKMSKSLGNCIGVSDAPDEIFGRVMSVSDARLLDYVDLLGAGEWDDLSLACEAVKEGGGDPLALKKDVAQRLVGRYHGLASAETATKRFQKVVQSREVPDDIPDLALSLAGATDVKLLDILTQLELTGTKSEARRLAIQGAIAIDGEREKDPTRRLAAGTFLIRVGKRRYARVTLS